MITNFLPPVPSSAAEALAMVFLHSLWQFTLLAAFLSLILKRNLIKSSPGRYAASLVTMGMMLLIAVATFFWYYKPESIEETNFIFMQVAHLYSPLENPSESTPNLSWLERLQPWILIGWILGILMLSIRWTGSMIYISWLKKRAFYPDDRHPLVMQWKSLCQLRNVPKKISIGLSQHISTPMIMGQIKPVILLPLCLVNQLTPQEAECILLHELAHYKRFDWWTNILQSWVEILFYYHPAIYFVSSKIRTERENCCDDFAIKTLDGSPVSYAKTLIKLQEWENSPAPQLALAFSNNHKIFVDRIQKILNMNQRKNVKNENILIGMIMVLSMFFATRETIAKSFDYEGAKTYLNDFFDFVKPSSLTAVRDTMPKVEESITIIKKGDEREVKIEMKNGEIKHLEINGEEIKPEDYDKHQDITKDVKIKSLKRKGHLEDSVFFFDMDGDNMRWHGNFDIKLDSLLGDFNWEDMQGEPFKMEKLQKKMHKLQEKMHDQQLRMFKMDSMITLEMPDRKMEWIFTPDDFRDMEEERIFEFHMPGEPKIQKRIEIERGDRFPGIEKRIQIERDGGFGGNRSTSDVLGNQLNKDGLLLPQKENKIELTGKYLKINGEKQPSNIWNKYKRIFEEESGTTLDKKSRITFHFLGKESKRTYKAY